MKSFLKNPTYACLLAAAILLVLVLFTSPFRGVGDSGNLYGPILSNGLYNVSDSTFAASQYGIKAGFEMPTNTESVIVRIAVSLNQLFSKDIFNIRVLAFLYSLLLLLSLLVVLKVGMTENVKTNWLLAVVLLVIFLDVGYITYFNSLHFEGAIYAIFLPLVVSGYYLSSSQKPNPIALVIFAIFTILFAGIKPEFSICAVFPAIYLLRYVMMHKEVLHRVVAAFMCALIVVSIIFMPKSQSIEQHKMSLYNSVFYGVLMNSKNLDKDLQDLGLPTTLKNLKGTTYQEIGVTQNSDFMNENFYSKMSYRKLILYYTTHPISFWNSANASASNGYFIRMSYLGNFEQSSGKLSNAQSNVFSFYSYIKSHAIPNTLIFTIIAFVAFLGVIIKYRISAQTLPEKLSYEFFIMIAIIAGTAFKLPVIFYGLAELGKNMFLYNVCFDIMLAISLVGGSRMLLLRQEMIKSKYGIK